MPLGTPPETRNSKTGEEVTTEGNKKVTHKLCGCYLTTQHTTLKL